MTVAPISYQPQQAFSGGVDFSPLANLGNVYREAQSREKLSDLGKKLAAGTIDYREAAGEMGALGDSSSMLKFLALAEQQRKEALGVAASEKFGGSLTSLVGGQPPSAAATIAAPPGVSILPPVAPNAASDEPAPARARVASTDRVIGDDEGEARGLYPSSVPLPRPRPADAGPSAFAAPEAPPSFGERFAAARPSGVAPAPVPPAAPAAPAAQAPAAPAGPDFVAHVPAAMAALRNPYLPEADKEIAKDIIKRGWDNATVTDKIKTLREFKRDANDPRSLLEIEKDLLTRAAPKTEVNLGEKKYTEAIEKDLAEDFIGMQKSGRAASGMKSSLDLMERAARDPNFDSGLLPGLTQAVKRGAAALGVADTDIAKPNEIFDKMANQVVLDVAEGKLGAGFSNTDRDFIRDTGANRQNTPEGNLAIINIQRKTAERKQVVARMAREYANEHKGKIDYNFYEKLDKYAEENPLFPQANTPAPAANPYEAEMRRRQLLK